MRECEVMNGPQKGGRARRQGDHERSHHDNRAVWNSHG